MWDAFSSITGFGPPAVIPVLVGPLQALLAILPGILVALGGLLLALFKPSALKRGVQLLWAQKKMVALAALCAGGLVYARYTLFAAALDEVVTAEAAAEGWPMWRGGAERRGAPLGSAQDPAHGQRVWSFYKNGIKSFYSSPTVVGNRVYATSARWELFKKDGAIYGLDAETGKLVWEYNADDYRATFSSPAVFEKYLVVGEGLHETQDARVFCLDLERSEARRTGVPLWTHRTHSHVESSPCIAEGKVFVGAGDDGLWCLDLRGENGQAKVLWHLEGKAYPDCETSPVCHAGRVYFGLGIGGRALCCVDAATGQELWRLPAPYPVFSSPTLSNGLLFVGMGNGDFINSAETLAGNLRKKLSAEGQSAADVERAVAEFKLEGEVWCVDLATHQKRWSLPVGRTVLGTLAAADGKLYFGSRDRRLYCASQDGKLLRSFDAHAPILTSPAVGRELVYCVTEAGILYGLDRQTLAEVWKVALNSPSVSSPALARGHAYVGTNECGLLCLGAQGREAEPPLWPGELGGPGKSGSLDGSGLPAQGAFAWNLFAAPGTGAKEDKEALSPAPLAYLDGAFYAGFAEGTQRGLARLERGKDYKAKFTRSWLAPSRNEVRLSPAGTADLVCFVDGVPGDSERKLRALNPKDGSESWSRPIESRATGVCTLTPQRLFIADREKGLTCLALSEPRAPRELWTSAPGVLVGEPCPYKDLVFFSLAEPACVAACDAQTGVELWRAATDAPPRTGPIILNRRVWVGTPQGVLGLNLADGRAACRAECGALQRRLVANSAWLGGVTAAGEVVLVDPASGELAARIADAAPGVTPLLTEDALLYQAKGALYRYDLAGRKTAFWTQTGWMGALLAPALMVDSHVFIVTEKRGLVCLKPKTP